MKGFKFEPVKWMTVILAVLTAAEGAQQFVDLLPEKVNGYILIAIAILTAVLGVSVHNRVTSLADPKDNDGNQLVPRQ